MWVVAGVALALLLLRPAALGIVGVFVVCMLWGIAGSGYSIVYQAEIIEFASDGEQTVAMAIFSGILNLGIGTGSFIGGGVCTFGTIAMWVTWGLHRAPCLTVLRIRADQTYESPELKVGPENNCSKSIISI